MTSLSAIPDTVDLFIYGGDTFTVKITAPATLVAGRVWSGQIRKSRTSEEIDATLQISPPDFEDGPAYVTLLAADSAALLEGLTPIRVRNETGQFSYVLRYMGVWDVQVAAPGGLDPVTTLVQGNVVAELDVTRAGP